jgi:4-amino-4-deoxy-L-arabinose transferase-like glycosyltransferase
MTTVPKVPGKATYRRLVLGVLLVHAGLLAWSATRHSPTIDEVGHLPAGLSHWELGRFNLYAVNPPLVRMTAALPVLAAGVEVDWSRAGQPPAGRAEFYIGRDLIRANGERSFELFTLARWACIPFSLLGGIVCFRWARELYGTAAGLLSLTLWCFGPNVLAHAQLITPDMGATALGVTAGYVFWHWLKRPSWSGAYLAGLALGLAELTKMTWVILFPLWPALWLAYRAAALRTLPARGRLRETGQLSLVLLLGLYLINLGYGFERPFQRLGDFRFVSRTLAGPDDGPTAAPRANRFAGTWLGELPVPVPANYLLGLDVQKRDFEHRMASYLRGEWRDHGWWYYYLYGLVVKLPLGTWVLILLALAISVTTKRYSAAWRDELFLLAPAAVLLALVSSQTGFNHHLRYILPCFPFAFIWLGKTAGAAVASGWKLRGVVATALASAVAATLWVYPHTLSYFNVLAGGPTGGHEHLVDSNIDWGQDLLYLKRWLDDHPEARPLHLAYFGNFDPRVAGIEFTLPPRQPDPADPKAKAFDLPPGWYAVSVSLLRGLTFGIPDGKGEWPFLEHHDSFAYFRPLRPVARAGYGIYIYRLTDEDVDRARCSLARSR